MNHKAFTLIELLVVVLIIGILAGVALPQYTKVVERSKSAQALTLVRAVAQAQQAYLLANGEYATKFDELAIDIPLTGNVQAIPDRQDTKSDSNWSLQIEKTDTNTINIYMLRINGKYKGAGFRLLLGNISDPFLDLPIYCMERTSGANFLFDSSLAEGAYCVQIMKGSFSSESQFNRIYTLP